MPSSQNVVQASSSSPEAEVSTYSTEFDGSQDFSNTLLKYLHFAPLARCSMRGNASNSCSDQNNSIHNRLTGASAASCKEAANRHFADLVPPRR